MLPRYQFGDDELEWTRYTVFRPLVTVTNVCMRWDKAFGFMPPIWLARIESKIRTRIQRKKYDAKWAAQIAGNPITPEMLKQQRIGVVSAETGLPRERVEQILRDNGSI